MAPEVIQKIEHVGGENACHRKQPVLLAEPLDKLRLVHQPCLREKCTLWDPDHDQCRDVTNALALAGIARSLSRLEDHLPPELP